MTRLVFAIPSKGRLKDNAEAWLGGCGFRLRQRGGARGYTADLDGLPQVDVRLLSAREIAEGLISGAIHVGVTGEDLLNDLSPDLARDAATLRPLGFGRADMVVAVPKAWLDVATMADLEAAGARFRARHGRRFRVATKYLNMTRRFFAEKSVGEYRLVESAGATEAAPAAGSADLIVDITSTGATLEANHLKILDDGVILRSQAVLAGSLHAHWDNPAREALAAFLDSVEARAAARDLRRLTAQAPIDPALADQIGLTDLTGHTAFCDAQKAANAARMLCDQGLGPVTVDTVDFIFRSGNATIESFFGKF